MAITYEDYKTEITYYENDFVEPAPACPKFAALLGSTGELQSAVETEQLATEWVPQHTAREAAAVSRCASRFPYGAADSEHARH